MTMPMQLILVGAGGHAKVLLALAESAGMAVVGVCDPGLARQGVQVWRGIPVLGGDDALDGVDPAATGLMNGIGQLAEASLRERIFVQLRAKHFQFPVLVHPRAWVAPGALLGEGVQVMAGAIIQPDCRIGANTLINTCASIDHDGEIGAHVHVAPGATLCGGVRVHDRAFIGSGATVIQGISIGERAIIGAGAVVVRDVAADARFVGAKGHVATTLTPKPARQP